MNATIQKYVVSSLLTLLLISCLGQGPFYSVPMASKEHDSIAKRFDVHPIKSVVYIYRYDRGLSVRTPIEVDGRDASYLLGNTFMRLELPPGRHILASKTEVYHEWKYNPYSKEIVCNPDGDSSLELSLEPGKLYFFRLAIFRKQQILFKLEPVNESDGRRDLTKSKWPNLVEQPNLNSPNP